MHKIKKTPADSENTKHTGPQSYYGKKPYYLNTPFARKRVIKVNKPEWRFEDIKQANNKQ